MCQKCHRSVSFSTSIIRLVLSSLQHIMHWREWRSTHSKISHLCLSQSTCSQTFSGTQIITNKRIYLFMNLYYIFMFTVLYLCICIVYMCYIYVSVLYLCIYIYVCLQHNYTFHLTHIFSKQIEYLYMYFCM